VSAFNLLGDLRGVNRRAALLLTRVSGANSEPVRRAAGELAKAIRKTLSQGGGGRPSAPGQPPRRQSGRLMRSVRHGAVGAGRRVAATRFTAPLLEAGVDTNAPPRAGRRRRRGGQARRRVRIAPRPFMARALDLARNKMIDVAVDAARDVGI
jgi:hypothetical protein